MSEIRARMGLEAGQFETGLQRVKSSVATFATSTAGIFAGAFSIGAIVAGFKQMVTELDKVANTARAFGVNVEDFQRFQYAIAQTGGSAEGLAKALRTLAVERAEALGDAGSNAAKAFAMLGISAEQLQNIKLGDLFQLTRNRLSEISNESDRAALAQEVLGRASLSMASSLEVASQQFDGFVQQAAVASQGAVEAGDKIDDAFTALGGNLKKSGADMVEALAPVVLFLTALPDHLLNSFRRVQEYAAATGSAMVTLFQDGPAAALRDFAASDRQIVEKLKADQERFGQIMRGEAVDRSQQQPRAERNVDVSQLRTDVERLEGGATGERALRDEERAKKDLLSAEEKYRDAVRDRETKSLDATEQIGRAEAEIINLQTQAADLADNTAAKFELLADIEKKRLEIMDLQNQRQEDAVRLAEEEARAAEKLADTRRTVEDLVAERQGPRAELELQRRRAAESAQLAREQGTAENVLAANQEANRLQRMLESDLRNRGFGDASLRRAQMQAQQVTGMVPGLEALRDITNKTDMGKPQQIEVQRLPLQDVLQRLDDLIRKAGSFS